MNAAQLLLHSSRLAEAPGAVPRLRLAGLANRISIRLGM